MSSRRMSSPFLSSSRSTMVWASSSGSRNHLDECSSFRITSKDLWRALSAFLQGSGEELGIDGPFGAQLALEQVYGIHVRGAEQPNLAFFHRRADLVHIAR